VQRETALYARDSYSHFSTRTRTVRYTVLVRRSTWFLIPSPSHAAKVPIFSLGGKVSAAISNTIYIYMYIYMKLPFLSVAYFCASHATNIILKHRTNCKSITREKLIHRCVDNENFTKQSNRILCEIHEFMYSVYWCVIVQILSWELQLELKNSINNCWTCRSERNKNIWHFYCTGGFLNIKLLVRVFLSRKTKLSLIA